MSRNNYDQLYDVMHSSIDLGILHLTTDDNGFSHNTVSFNNKSYYNFSLCDYLNLSQDERLKAGAIKAIEQHGVCTTVSKSYIKLKLYEEAEHYLSKVFKHPSILFSRSTLAHLGVLPVVVDPDDAVIIDHQAHESIRIASTLLKGQSVYCEVLKHNRIDILEDKIKELQTKYRKIWYLADSVYSMYGDVLPYEELKVLLHQYESFHLYVDDAHGISWNGEQGRGFLLEHMAYHPRMMVIGSLVKGFGAGGGVAICYDDKMRDRLVTCAAPLIFSSPVCPPTLGAIIESSKIHLSNEIAERQLQLEQRMVLFNAIASQLNLPVISDPQVPITFIATGKPDMCQEICLSVYEKGFYVNAAHYPAVPINNSGIRALISLHQQPVDIVEMLNVLKEAYDKALNKRGITIADITKFYKLKKQLVK